MWTFESFVVDFYDSSVHDDDDDAFVRCSLLSCHVEPSTNYTGEY